MKLAAFIFDMDDTMIDSTGHHRQSWIGFAKAHGLAMPIDELMRSTSGRTGAECMVELSGRKLGVATAPATRPTSPSR